MGDMRKRSQEVGIDMRRILWLAIAAIGVATPSAAEITEADRRSAAEGEIIVRVEPDPAGATARIEGLFVVAAPPEPTWAVMIDCPRSLTYVKGLKACNVLSREPDGRADVREHVINRLAILPTVRSVFRTEYDRPREMRFSRAGGDLKVMEGTWRLRPLAGGTRTELAYTARIGLDTLVPAGVLRPLIQSETAATFADLKAEVERGTRR
jgi:hypothetical protein